MSPAFQIFGVGIYEFVICMQTSQVSRFCRETHGFQFNLTVSEQDRQISQ